MNANVVQMSDEEYETYIRLYFQQPEDVAKLYMDDLRKVIEILSKIDLKATEEVVLKIKDDLTDRQWEFVIAGCPSMVKYSPQSVQNNYSDKEEYNVYLNGDARKSYVDKKLEQLKDDNLTEPQRELLIHTIEDNKYQINSSKEIIKLIQSLKVKERNKNAKK
mgnify:CR=1 FL=1